MEKPKGTAPFFMCLALYIIVFICFSIPIFAQSPVACATGGAYLADTTVWCASSNPSLLTNSRSLRGGLAVQNRYFISDLIHYHIAASFAVKNVFTGIDVQYRGLPEWNEKNFGFAAAAKLSKSLSLGARAAFSHIWHGSDRDGYTFFIPQIAASYVLNPAWDASISASIADFINYRQSPSDMTHILAGAARYRASDRLRVTAQAGMYRLAGIAASAGMEYSFNDRADFRFGLSTGKQPIAAGVSLKLQGLWLDFSAQYHYQLGTVLTVGARVGL
jgi:hypothetical protein